MTNTTQGDVPSGGKRAEGGAVSRQFGGSVGTSERTSVE